MVQSELFKRYIWLVDLIYRNDGITRDEINRSWRQSHLNNRKEENCPSALFTGIKKLSRNCLISK